MEMTPPLEHSGSPFSMDQLREDLEEFFRRFDLIQKQHDLVQELDRVMLSTPSSPDKVLDLIVKKGLHITDSQHCQITINHRSNLIVQACSSPEQVGVILPIEGSLCGRAFRENKDQHTPDVNQLEEYHRFFDDTQSELTLLIKQEHSRRILGLLVFERNRRGFFDEAALGFAKLLTGQAAIAIVQARIWKSVESLHTINTELLSEDIPLEQAYQQILETLLDVLNFEYGQVLRRVGREFIIIASNKELDIGLRIGPENSVCGNHLLTKGKRKVLRINDLKRSRYRKFYRPPPGLEKEIKMRSEMIVPLIEDGSLIGAFNIESPQVKAFSDLDETLLDIVGNLMVRALSAAFSRNAQINKERTGRANATLAQLGAVSHNFLHRFSSDLGYVRSGLMDLQKHLKGHSLPNIGEETVSEYIQDLSDNLSESFNNIVDFRARFNPETATLTFEQKPMDFFDVAESVVEKYRPKYDTDKITIDFVYNLPEELGKKVVCKLTDQIYEVVEILLDNAIDAIRERRKQDPAWDEVGLIEVAINLPDPFSGCVKVTDNGIGIAPEIQGKVFEFGFSTKERQRPLGGMGLSFCQLHARQLGGELIFNSNFGSGTCFELCFPLTFTDTLPDDKK